MIRRILFEAALTRRCARVCDILPSSSTAYQYSSNSPVFSSDSNRRDEIFSHGMSLMEANCLNRPRDDDVSSIVERDDRLITADKIPTREDCLQMLTEEHYKRGGEILRVLELGAAICRRDGVEGVKAFISDYRRQFLVRRHPGGSPRYRAAERRLFVAAFQSLGQTEWKTLEPCWQVSELCDFLVDQLLVGSREGFVDAGVDFFLQQSMFAEAFCFWRTQLRVYHTRFGLQPLLNYVIARYDEHEGVCRDRIVEIMRESESVVKPTEYLASVIVAMLMNGHFADAETFSKLFSVPGLHFIYALRKLADEDSVELLEKFSELLSHVYFTELITKRPAKRPAVLKPTTSNGPVAEAVQSDEPILPPASVEVAERLAIEPESVNKPKQLNTITISSMCKFRFLLNVWKLPVGMKNLKKFMKKKSKPRNHTVDIQQLNDLTHSFMRTWIGAAGLQNDCESLLRLHTFVVANQLQVRPQVAARCRAVFRRNGRLDTCPFDEPPGDSTRKRRKSIKSSTENLHAV